MVEVRWKLNTNLLFNQILELFVRPLLFLKKKGGDLSVENIFYCCRVDLGNILCLFTCVYACMHRGKKIENLFANILCIAKLD